MMNKHHYPRLRYYSLLLLFFLAGFPVCAWSQSEDEATRFVMDSAQEDEQASFVDSLVADTVAPPIEWPQTLRMRMEELLTDRLFRTSTVGIQVYDLTADSAIFSYNEQQRMRPASTMKLFTAITALDRLGEAYLFRTLLKYKGKVDDLTLTGDLYCQGGFDPRFNSDDMKAFAESVKRLGIDTIRGNIYADLSMKDDDLKGEGWCWDDDDNPELSPLLVSGKNRFLNSFSDELKNAGIVFLGTLKTGVTPSDARLICQRTHTMDQILIRMMKKSDNLYAESMFYQLAASSGVRRPGAKQARVLINRLVERLRFNPADFYFADGSGLSLYTYVSPSLEVAFLRYAYQNNNIYSQLWNSLPIAGVDGTLDTRMQNTAAYGNVHAKTGTVRGVSSLAGYCTAPNGHELCFSIINMGVSKSSQGREFQDRVCAVLCSVE